MVARNLIGWINRRRRTMIWEAIPWGCGPRGYEVATYGMLLTVLALGSGFVTLEGFVSVCLMPTSIQLHEQHLFGWRRTEATQIMMGDLMPHLLRLSNCKIKSGSHVSWLNWSWVATLRLQKREQKERKRNVIGEGLAFKGTTPKKKQRQQSRLTAVGKDAGANSNSNCKKELKEIIAKQKCFARQNESFGCYNIGKKRI